MLADCDLSQAIPVQIFHDQLTDQRRECNIAP